MRYVMLSLVFVMGCSEQKFFEYGQGAEVLKPYVESFDNAYKAHFGFARRIPVAFFFEDDLAGQLATCRETSGAGTIFVSRTKWDLLCEGQKKGIIWHEMGHCVLGRDHIEDTEVVTYMHVNAGQCDYYTENEDELDFEMFDWWDRLFAA